MNQTTPEILYPTYVEMKQPVSTFEAAMLLAGLTPATRNREARKNPTVMRLQSDIQKACLIYENEEFSDDYRLHRGIPSGWDGGIRVIERFQAEQWNKRKYTRVRFPKYKQVRYA